MDLPETPNSSSTIHPRKFAFLGPAQAQDELGRLGRFRILKVLGKGGMGMVFKAEDPVLQRVVAVKVMLPEFAKKTTSRERFLREARAAAKIEHEHVIAIHHVDEDHGVPFIAMTFLKGMSLDDWLKKKGPLTTPQILRIGREIARGLAAAHQQGVIHRDIKPANLWLDSTTKGRIKILDFGLARPESESTGLTRSGQLIGTPAYMSPEQAAGEKLDARTDVFSLGVVLYRLCTGILPFTGKTVMAVLTSLASTEPEPAAQANPDVPPALSDLIARMLRKKPSDRPASAQEVADALATIERDRQLSQLGLTDTKPSKPGISMIEISRTQSDRTHADRTHAEDDHRTRPSQHVHFEDSGDSFLEETEFDREPTRFVPVRPRTEPIVPFIVGACVVAGIVVTILIVTALMPPATQPGVAEAKPKTPQPKAAPFVEDPNRPPLATVPFDEETAKRHQKTWADFVRKNVVETNSIGMKLVLVPAGRFVMGSPDGEPGHTPGAIEHEVVITKPYFIGVYEVTQEEYESILGSNPSTFSAAGVRSESVEGVDTKRFPVDHVFWNNAVSFCYRLSALPAEAKSGRRYRLPTEAEWEFASRAGRTGPLSVSFAQKSIGRSKLVTEANGNPFGIFGMQESMLEWCQDWHAPYPKTQAVDPVGPAEGVKRILRGSAWSDQAGRPQGAAIRAASQPGIVIGFQGGSVVGFRIVCDVALPR